MSRAATSFPECSSPSDAMIPLQRQRWTEERRADLRDMWAKGWKVDMMAEALQTSRGAIYVQAGKLGLSRRLNGQTSLTGDRTRQRRFTGVEHKGQRIEIQPWHPAVRNGGTIYGQRVQPAGTADRLLKSGEHNRKIGKMSVKGRWKGPIYTLTLEERATCPRSCAEWTNCYGNNMGHAPRLFDDGTLEVRLAGEIAHLNAIHPRGFIVRLHVLGDFYSTSYVQFWRAAMATYPALHVWGFTARQPADPIGRAALEMMRDNLDRCIIRVSGGGLPELCAEVVTSADQASGIICPAQLDQNRSCATCGLCWTSERTITFLRH